MGHWIKPVHYNWGSLKNYCYIQESILSESATSRVQKQTIQNLVTLKPQHKEFENSESLETRYGIL